jgi:hypothetical protein
MFGCKYLRAHAAQLIAVSHTIADVVSKAALIAVADDLKRTLANQFCLVRL